MTQFGANDNFTPKKIGNFNVPKNVIECKIDTLAILELMLRKNIATWEEIDEIREAVVMHMNVMFPELQLTYSTPQPLKDEAPLTPPEEQKPAKPLFYSAPPPEMAGAAPAAPKPQAAAPQNAPQAAQQPPSADPAANRPNIQSGPKPIMPNAGPPKILNSPPRKKI